MYVDGNILGPGAVSFVEKSNIECLFLGRVGYYRFYCKIMEQ